MKKVYNEKLKTWFSEPDCVDEWLEMSKEARKCLRENKLFSTEER